MAPKTPKRELNPLGQVAEDMGLNPHRAFQRFGFVDRRAAINFFSSTESINMRAMMSVFVECDDDAYTFLRRFADYVGIDISRKAKKRRKR